MAQKKNPDCEQTMTIVTFSGMGMDGVQLIRDRQPALETKEILWDEYVPCGCTPLYDAMGFGITSLQKSISSDDLVLVTVITDGQENSSRIYNHTAIHELVESCRKMGWTFAYIGANQDSVKVASSMGIANALDYETTDEGVKAMSDILCQSRIEYSMNAKCRQAVMDDTSFFRSQSKKRK